LPLLEHILPAAGEFALGDDIGPAHHGGAAEACNQYGIALLDLGGLAQRHRLWRVGAARAPQAEAAFVIVADDVRRYGAPVVVDDLGRVGLDHEIADRQHKTGAIDDDA